MTNDTTSIDNDKRVVLQQPLSWRQRLPSWRGNPEFDIGRCESILLSALKTSYRSFHVELSSPKRKIWTICLNEDKEGTPLVLVHGFGAGSALWMRNFDDLSANRPLFAIDLLGFGRSSRDQLHKDSEKTAEDWAETIEEWRVRMGIDVMNLLAHSLGGYISSIYSVRHPERIERLLLIEPWGYPEPPRNANGETVVDRPLLIRIIIRLMFTFHPLSVIRVAGPFGPNVIQRVRPDLGRKYAPTPDIAPYIYKYIYCCNAKTPPSGETAFKRLVDKNGFASIPMVRLIGQLPLSVPITVVLGQDSWVDSNTGKYIKEARADFHQVDIKHSNVDFHIVEQAGHHLYVEQSDHFNLLINRVLQR